jgi:hypothetical protein
MLRLYLRLIPLFLGLTLVLCGVALLARIGTTPTALVYSQFKAGVGRYYVYVDTTRGMRTPVLRAAHDPVAGQGRPVSPDGTMSVSTRPTANGVDLYIRVAGDGIPRRLTRWDAFTTGNLTNDMRSNTYPVWSPDGEWVAFISSDSSAQMDIYVIRPDGSGIRRLASDVGTPTPLEIRWSSFQELPLDLAALALIGAVLALMVYPKPRPQSQFKREAL